MSLTLTQAQQAGTIAGQIVAITAGITLIQNALADGVMFQTMQATTTTASAPSGIGDLMFALPMSAADSATILNAIMGVLQADLSALNAQLATIGS